MFTSSLLIAATWFWQLKLSHLPLLSWDVGEGHEPARGLILIFLIAFYAYSALGLLLRWQVEVAAASTLDGAVGKMDAALEQLDRLMTLKDRRAQLHIMEKRGDEIAAELRSIRHVRGDGTAQEDTLERIRDAVETAMRDIRSEASGIAITPRQAEELRQTFHEAEEAIRRSAAEIRNLMSAERFERTALGFWVPAVSSFTLVAVTTAAAWPEITNSLLAALHALWARLVTGA